MAYDQANALAEIENANQRRLKKEYSGKAGTKFVTEVRESMLYRYNWADLLSAAPTALSLLGACFLVSSSQEASAISLGSAIPPGCPEAHIESLPCVCWRLRRQGLRHSSQQHGLYRSYSRRLDRDRMLHTSSMR
jgi:hypothetical protein